MGFSFTFLNLFFVHNILIYFFLKKEQKFKLSAQQNIMVQITKIYNNYICLFTSYQNQICSTSSIMDLKLKILMLIIIIKLNLNKLCEMIDYVFIGII